MPTLSNATRRAIRQNARDHEAAGAIFAAVNDEIRRRTREALAAVARALATPGDLRRLRDLERCRKQ